jgi:hypothetical protein
MGAGSFNPKAYQRQAEEAKSSSNSGFLATSMCDEFNPAKVSLRHSKSGPFNEFKDVTTVLIGLDVTGSMGKIPKSLLAGKLGSLMDDLLAVFNRPTENLQISFAGLGDAKTDNAPLQVTHFESDNRFVQQLQKLWLESGGGGNGAENYNLLWWYAGNKTELSYVEKENRKGILITIGDDNVHPSLTASEIRSFLEPNYEGGDVSNSVMLEAARKQYDVYHITITDGSSYAQDNSKRGATKSAQQKAAEAKQWTDLLGKDNVVLTTSDKVAETIAEIVKRYRLPNERPALDKAKLTDEQWQEVLSYTLCPLTRKFINDPVDWNNNKRAYERQAVEEYVRVHHKDPLTQTRLTAKLVFKPNSSIAQLCANYRSFFDALPEDRKTRLVQAVLGDPKQVDHKEVDNSGNASHAFWSKAAAPAVAEAKHEQLIPMCSITGERFINPVILIETGQTYEEEYLKKWFEQKNTDPLSGKELKSQAYIVNFEVKRICDAARDAESAAASSGVTPSAHK